MNREVDGLNRLNYLIKIRRDFTNSSTETLGKKALSLMWETAKNFGVRFRAKEKIIIRGRMVKATKERCRKPTARKYNYHKRRGIQAM